VASKINHDRLAIVIATLLSTSGCAPVAGIAIVVRGDLQCVATGARAVVGQMIRAALISVRLPEKVIDASAVHHRS